MTTQHDELMDREILASVKHADNMMATLDQLASGTVTGAVEVCEDEDWVEQIDLEWGDDPKGALSQILKWDVLEVKRLTDDEYEEGEPVLVLVWGTGGPHIQTRVYTNGRCVSEGWTWWHKHRQQVTRTYSYITDTLFEIT